MNEAMQFIVVLGSAVVLVVGLLGVPLILGLLGASRLKAFEQRLAEMEQHSRQQLTQMEERLDFAERLLTQARERGGLRPGEPPS